MIQFTKVSEPEFAAAIRGMRNSWESHDKSDSDFADNCRNCKCDIKDCDCYQSNLPFKVGPNDLKLMKKLIKAGSDHAKFMRQITLSLDINAPFYFWKQFDQYRVGVTSNSTSTMHKIHSKPFTLDMFSLEQIERKNYSYDVEIKVENEVWKSVKDIDSVEVSNSGKVRRNGKELSVSVNSAGYKKVTINSNGKYINKYLHRLMAEVFIENECDWKTEVNHKDGNKLNNNLDNLEWVSKSENAIHSFEKGLSRISGYNKNRVRQSIGKFNKEQIKEIKEMRKNGISTNEIAKKFDCYSSTICNIVNGKSYKDIEFDAYDVIKLHIDHLELLRLKYLETKDKDTWDLIIKLLPDSFMQTRTITLNYSVLANMYHSRKNHKLTEWKDFCDWVKTLPYSELITGE